ncbi:MAG: hypothetical protein CVU44_04800 [Chloroflexi bacterium HGW-Chloroflexi-6]|nr:MAG: hypothetical protein CVU44_04800 [Chloroflexi bacterium HGW-Chloroflexi-6]
MTDFNGWPTLVLENQFLRLETLAASPRIVRFNPIGKLNMFANLGNEPVPTPYGDFYFRGGHRLWHSPEAMPRTYIPDNDGALATQIPNGLRFDQPAEAWTHIAKSMEIRLNPERPQVILQHELRNDGPWAVELAPWALTMFRQGGTAIFPQPVGNADPAGLLANRQISIWPYTKVNDPRLILRDDFILLRATPSLPPVKIGYFNPAGWQGYYLEGVLFVKRFDPQPGEVFPDGGCNTESYCNHQFIELESLGALTRLQPGETVTHNEIWDVYEGIEQDFIPAEIQGLLRSWLG